MTSEQGREFIERQEGTSPTVYKDVAEIPTVGWGHKLTPAEAAFLKDAYPNGIPAAMAEFLLLGDLESAEHSVRTTIHNVGALSQNQFDALASFAFNIGPTAFAKSTLAKKVNDGDFAGAADEFSRWTYAGGKFSQSLANRRAAEKDLFQEGAYI